jgi:Arc/MetJ family transcription regulator
VMHAIYGAVMRTTVTIDDQLLAAAKASAYAAGQTLG